MSLAEGARLGAYEILGVLGAGAMGKVYRARDTRLGREVAIKVLPEEFADNADRRRRFEQESRAASALSHPGIVAVYEADERDGISYIVSELVEGESLRAVVGRGPAPVRKAVEIAAELAEALAAAHAAGIVHRDLKPENVMLTREGRAKILDFGLARYEPARAPEGTLTMTQPGAVLGTPGYMAPEQVAGKPADARADVFALGTVLYELLAGSGAFTRATAVETMSAILREDPPALPVSVPANVAAIVEHCLEKEPERRYQSARDLAFALRSFHFGAGPARGRAADQGVRPTYVLMAVVAAIAIYAVAGLVSAPEGADLGAYRFTPFVAGADPVSDPSWSPDGKSIAYMRTLNGQPNELLMRSLDSMAPISIARADFTPPAMWMPDGTRLLLLMRDGIYSVSRAGGARQQVLAGDFGAAALSPDGKSLALWLVGANLGQKPKLWISSPPGAAPREYEPVAWQENGSTLPVHLRFSPDGRKLAVSRIGNAGPEMWLLAFPGGGKAKRIFPTELRGSPPSISWMPDSRHMVLRVSENGTRLWMGDTETGSLRPLTAGEGGISSAAVSPDGSKIAYDTLAADFDIVAIPVDGAPLRPLLATSRNEDSPAWSPTGTQMAFVTNRSGRPEIWTRSAQEGWERPLGTQQDSGEETLRLGALAFSPSGDRLAYTRTTSKHASLIWIAPTAGGAPVRLTNRNDFEFGPAWSPDGNWILYTSAQQGIVKIRVGAGEPPVSVLHKYCDSPLAWAPDGRWLACGENGSVVVLSPDGKSTRTLESRDGAYFTCVAWSRDSRMLYALGQIPGSQWGLTAIDFRGGSERVISRLGLVYFGSNAERSLGLSLSPDGKTLATSTATLRSEIWLLEGYPQPRSLLKRLLWWER